MDGWNFFLLNLSITSNVCALFVFSCLIPVWILFFDFCRTLHVFFKCYRDKSKWSLLAEGISGAILRCFELVRLGESGSLKLSGGLEPFPLRNIHTEDSHTSTAASQLLLYLTALSYNFSFSYLLISGYMLKPLSYFSQ